MNLFGGSKKFRQKYRVVPRGPGDTAPPLDPMIADAMRKAGMDPEHFALAPFEAGEAAPAVAALFTSGDRLEHTFSFDTLNRALSAVERIVDDGVSARIGKQVTKWLVVFDGPADAAVPASEAHQKIATRVLDLEAEDQGFSHLTMNVGRPVSSDDP